MNIVSLLYLAFVAVVALAYFITPRRFRWVTLLIASVANYLSYDLKLAVWMFITSVTIYVGGLLIDRQEQKFAAQLKVRTDLDRAGKRALKKQNERVKKRWAALVAAVNIAIWVVFKFADLFITALNKYLSGNLSLWHLVLPLGISFYTLQAISYVVDLSRGKCEVQRNYFKLLLWLCFFPQMLQGPICRYRETAPQLYEPHDFDYRRVKFGMQRMLWGYFKKLVIADRVVSVSEKVFGNSGDYQGLVFVIGALAYTIQIYADFSGGMDIIGGAAEILGVYMPVNFDHPYFAVSVQDFWRRWHMSLSAWLKDYVYIPLGGNRGGTLRKYINLFLTFLVSGFWHGEGVKFIFWGVLHACYQILGTLTRKSRDRIYEALAMPRGTFAWRLYRTAGTFFWVMTAWIIFRADSLRAGLHMIRSMVTVFNPWILLNGTLETFMPYQQWELLTASLLILLAVSRVQEKMSVRDWIARQHITIRWGLALGCAAVIIVFGTYGFGYDAQAFIYGGF